MTKEILGGYTAFRKIEEKEKALFEKTMNLKGVSYTPLAVATQVVSGTNYRFLCEAKVVIPDPVPYNTLVTVYAPLQGESVITEIKNVVIE